MFVFFLVNVHLDKANFEILPFELYCHCFYCKRGSRMFGKCEICSRFFFDDMDVAKKLDRAFVLTKKII